MFLLFVGAAGYALVANYNTQDVIVAVLDSPVAVTHPLLKGKTLDGLDLVHEHTEKAKEHGTHVAGIITKIEPRAKILPISILGDQKKQHVLPETAFGIVYAVLKGADVINMSFAQDGKDPFTYMALKFAAYKGVTLVAAAGNDGINKLSYPSKFNDVIAVGAYDESDHTIYEDSNYSKTPIFAAPGVWVRSASPNGNYVEKSGTSMSAAYVSGMIAHLKEKDPSLTLEEIKKTLKKASNLVYNKRSRMLALDMEKLNALETGKPYVWISGYQNYTDQPSQTLSLQTLNIQKTLLRDSYGEKNIPNQGKIHLELREGVTFYELVLTDKKGNIQTKDISYVFDDRKPQLTVKRVRLGGEPALKVKVDSWTIKTVSLANIQWKVKTVGTQYHTFYFFIDPAEKRYKITAKNYVGQKTTFNYLLN